MQLKNRMWDQVDIDSARPAKLGDLRGTLFVPHDVAGPLLLPLVVDCVVFLKDVEDVIGCCEVKADREAIHASHLKVDRAELAFSYHNILVNVLLLLFLLNRLQLRCLLLLLQRIVLLLVLHTFLRSQLLQLFSVSLLLSSQGILPPSFLNRICQMLSMQEEGSLVLVMLGLTAGFICTSVVVGVRIVFPDSVV